MHIFRTAGYYLLPVIPLWLYALWIVSFGHDDSHITFWAAKNLAATGEILNYNGERIEQSSSLLFTIILALLNSLGLSVVTAGYLSGFVAAHIIIWGTVYWLNQQGNGLIAVLAGLGIACSPYFAAWSLSGMETTIATLCVLVYLYIAYLLRENPSSRLWFSWFAVSLALAAVRPEMPVVIAVHATVSYIVTRQQKWLVPLLAITLLVIWRLWYFAAIFPNPVYAKAGTDWLGQLFAGISYVLRLNEHWQLATVSIFLALTSLASALIALFKRQNTYGLWLCSSWVGIYAAFVIATGGDWMREGRFWVPLIASSWIGLALLLTQFKLPKLSPILMLIPIALLSFYSINFIKKFNSGIPIWQHQTIKPFASPETSLFELHNREHLRDWPAIRTLKQLLNLLPSDQPISLMSKQMGMVVFHIKSEFPHVTVIDTAGLVENSLRSCAPLRQIAGFDWQGLRLNYPTYFTALQNGQVCGQVAPDIIYDLFGWAETTPLPEILAANGYTPIFIQYGNLDIPGPVRSAKEIIAVRTSLLSNYHLRTIQGVFSDFTYPDPIIGQPKYRAER